MKPPAKLYLLGLVWAALLAACGGGGGSVAPPPPSVITVSVSPANVTVLTGATQQFTATVTGTTNTGVNWSVENVSGGNATVGRISAGGLYTAPGVPPSPNTVTVKATSVAEATKSDTAAVAVANPAPQLNSLSPLSVNAGSGDTTLTLLGSGFAQQSVVEAGGTGLATTFVSATQLQAVVPAAQLATAGPLPITVVTPAPGGGTSAARDLAVLIVVEVSPASLTMNTGLEQQFTATVTGSANQTVSWWVDQFAGGNATVGTIDGSGLYTAPATPPSPNAVMVKAASVVDPTRTASASVTLVNPVPVVRSVTPASVGAGSGDTVLVVRGSGFTPQSVVQFATALLATTFGSVTELTAVIPAAELTTAGTVLVAVVTPGPGGGTSNPEELTILIVVTVSPATPTVPVTQTQQFAATVAGTADTRVTWFVNDTPGGNGTVGAIDAAGLFTAPSIPPSPNTATVKATSVADASRSGSTSVTIVNPVPAVLSLNPSAVNAGSGDTPLTLTGSGFAQQSRVEAGGTGLATTFVSATQLQAVVPAAQLATAGPLPITVVTPAPGGGTSAARDLTVLIVVEVSPANVTVLTSGTQQFTAAVIGTTNQAVTWSVNDVGGGNASLGTISAAGFYTAPGVPPSPNTVTVKATSVADATKSETAAVAVANPGPQLNSLSPPSVNAGSGDTTLTLLGSGFAQQSQVQAGGTGLVTTFVSSTELQAVVPAGQLALAGSLAITVVTPGPGGGTSAARNLAVLIVVEVSPAAVTLTTRLEQQFTAAVIGSANQAVTWSVQGVVGGNATVGTISAAGIYTAPAVPPSPNLVTVTATSVVDPSRSSFATVTIVNPLPVLTSLSPTAIAAGSPQTALTLTGTGFTPQSMAQFAGVGLATTSSSSTQLTAFIPAAQLTTSGTFAVTVVTPQPGGGTSNALSLEVRTAVSLSPSSVDVSVNETKHFQATVYGIADQTVTWYVNDVLGGDDIFGRITADGIYIGPPTIPNPSTVSIKAISTGDPTKFGLATATVILQPSDNYPRPGAGSVLRSSPPLAQIPLAGALVAVLDWVSKDPNGTEEELLALCHTFSPFGIPHIHTSNLAEAAAYPFLAVAGVMEDGSLSGGERAALIRYVQDGGTLLLWRPGESGLLADLGISSLFSEDGVELRPLTFDLSSGDPALGYVDHEVEVNWQLAYPDWGDTRGYDAGSGTTLASWSRGGAAVLRVDLGTGRAYVFGWRQSSIVVLSELRIVPGGETAWTNILDLDADICRLLVRAIYEGWGGPGAPLRQFAPGGKPAALIITHDVDARVSYENVPAFAQFDVDRGLRTSYYFTTMPYSSTWAGVMYTLEGMDDIRQALTLGHDIGSHSFGHFPDFTFAPLGSGGETAENYMPDYSAHLGVTIGFSALGEMGVSRWLLENDFGISVETYRSGELLVPEDFLEALQATGYRRDTTYPMGLTRSSFPFVPIKVSAGLVTTFPVLEFPVALSEEGLTVETLPTLADEWERVVRANYANNAPTVLLVHPTTSVRLDLLSEVLLRIADLNLWIGDLKTFADFWEAQGATCERWP